VPACEPAGRGSGFVIAGVAVGNTFAIARVVDAVEYSDYFSRASLALLSMSNFVRYGSVRYGCREGETTISGGASLSLSLPHAGIMKRYAHAPGTPPETPDTTAIPHNTQSSRYHDNSSQCHN